MNPRHSYAYLDGVRGWAALMVAASHFIDAMQPAMLGRAAQIDQVAGRAAFAGSTWLGHSGLIVLYNPQLPVDVFFVLSGFVLATSVDVRPAPFLELAVRRWLRLGLPILGSTALIWPLVHWHLFWDDTAGTLANSNWLWGFYNWTKMPHFPDITLPILFWQSLVTVFVPGVHWYNPALWTMKAEFWGSMGLYFGYCLLPRGLADRGVGMLVALVATAVLVNQPLLASFCFGVVLFESVRLLRRQPARVAALARVAPAAAIVLLAAAMFLGGIPYDIDFDANGFYARLYNALSPWIGVIQLLTYRLAALCLVTAALLWRPLQLLLLTRPSQWLGRVSFMLYLVHVPILCSFGAWLLVRLAPLLGYNRATLVVLPCFLAAALAVAGLTTRLIDEPSIKAARRVGAMVMPALRRLWGTLRPLPAR